jgi:hypothetical protein
LLRRQSELAAEIGNGFAILSIRENIVQIGDPSYSSVDAADAPWRSPLGYRKK